MLTDTKQRLQLQGSEQIQIKINRKNISQVEKANTLAVYWWQINFWKNHAEEMSKMISSDLGALKRLRPFVS